MFNRSVRLCLTQFHLPAASRVAPAICADDLIGTEPCIAPDTKLDGNAILVVMLLGDELARSRSGAIPCHHIAPSMVQSSGGIVARHCMLRNTMYARI